MKKIFLSFADMRMTLALKRINSQAQNLKIYDQIIIANEFNLDINFREKYKNYLNTSHRGFGYWIWKPQIILQILNQLEDGDLLQYTDAGCHLNKKGKERLIEYFEILRKSQFGILGFQAIPPSFHNNKVKLPDLMEYKWCKGDLIDYFGVREFKSIMETQSIGATVIFIKKNDKTVDFIKKWIKVYETNMNLIDNSPSIIKNYDGFIEHRNDQSIFSILGKISKIDIISAYEYYYPNYIIPTLPNWKILKKYPIHAKRDKGVDWYKKPKSILIRVLKRIKLEIKKEVNNELSL